MIAWYRLAVPQYYLILNPEWLPGAFHKAIDFMIPVIHFFALYQVDSRYELKLFFFNYPVVESLPFMVSC